MPLFYKKLLLVVKHTPFEMYSQMKQQGRAPLALRWERLKNRHMIHRECVDSVRSLLHRLGATYNIIGREELDRQHLSNVDLVIPIGGDGTVLSAAHFIGEECPVLGVNSDPDREEEKRPHEGKKKFTDERRSYGALCAVTSANMEQYIPRMLLGDIKPLPRTRIQTVIQSTLKETKLPPALNDVLIAHPNPAAVSRFRMRFVNRTNEDSDIKNNNHKNYYYSSNNSIRNTNRKEQDKNFCLSTSTSSDVLNVWSSGMWVSTATGSSAAIYAAGGHFMDPMDPDLQYMIREHLIESGKEYQEEYGKGIIKGGEQLLNIRWSSLEGDIYVDGSSIHHGIKLGDEVIISNEAPKLHIFPKISLSK